MGDYYYHYTSLKSLASILDTKSILLNPLDTMDDIEDGKTGNFIYARKYVFCSSWTDQKDDLTLWSMYGEKMHGVCIGLCKKPFSLFEWDKDYMSGSKTIIPKGQYYLPPEDALGREYTIAVSFNNMFFQEVKYSDNLNELYPDVLNWKNNNRALEIDMGKVGLFKHKLWEKQKEWRYRVVCFPINYKNMAKLDSQRNGVYNYMQKGVELPLSHIRLYISDKAFNTMQIIKGPKMSKNEEISLERLLEKHDLSQNVISSQLHMRA